MPKENLKRALSIRQPLSEWILTGEKTEEFRAGRTNIHERVYLYAGKELANVDDVSKKEAASLPRSAIVGSVEIVGCRDDEEEEGRFVWELANPIRYPTPLKPKGVPQPGFWHPKF